MKIIFLGTGGSMPTKDRGLTSIAVRRENDLFLFDCAEGTQRQMTHTEVSPMNIDMILLTHFHGDHFLGIPGLVQTMSLLDREKPLEIFGPEGTQEKISNLLQVPLYTLDFEIRINDLQPGDTIEREEYRFETASIEHSTEGLAYVMIEEDRPGKFYPEKAKELGVEPGPKYSRLQEGENLELEDGTIVKPEQVMGSPRSGRKIVYSGDTRPTEEIKELAKDADVLIHDATFGNDLEEEATQGGHSTAAEAAELAKQAEVEQLILTHPSPRYKDLSQLEEEAKEIFPNTKYAKDFSEIEVQLKK